MFSGGIEGLMSRLFSKVTMKGAQRHHGGRSLLLTFKPLFLNLKLFSRYGVSENNCKPTIQKLTCVRKFQNIHRKTPVMKGFYY